MPKVYISMEERAEAERKRFNEQQAEDLRTTLLKAKKMQKITISELAKKAKVGESTARHVLDYESDMGKLQFDNVRKVCGALGLKFIFCVE